MGRHIGFHLGSKRLQHPTLATPRRAASGSGRHCFEAELARPEAKAALIKMGGERVR